MNRFLLNSTIAFCCLVISSCAKNNYPTTTGFSAGDTTAPNYADLNSWAAHPYKTDPSDSVPLAIRNGYQPDSTVNVFFILPTSFLYQYILFLNCFMLFLVNISYLFFSRPFASLFFHFLLFFD